MSKKCLWYIMTLHTLLKGCIILVSCVFILCYMFIGKFLWGVLLLLIFSYTKYVSWLFWNSIVFRILSFASSSLVEQLGCSFPRDTETGSTRMILPGLCLNRIIYDFIVVPIIIYVSVKISMVWIIDTFTCYILNFRSIVSVMGEKLCRSFQSRIPISIAIQRFLRHSINVSNDWSADPYLLPHSLHT